MVKTYRSKSIKRIKVNQAKRKNIDINGTQIEAFNNLKALLTSSEILSFPKFEKPFILTTTSLEQYSRRAKSVNINRFHIYQGHLIRPRKTMLGTKKKFPLPI